MFYGLQETVDDLGEEAVRVARVVFLVMVGQVDVAGWTTVHLTSSSPRWRKCFDSNTQIRLGPLFFVRGRPLTSAFLTPRRAIGQNWVLDRAEWK